MIGDTICNFIGYGCEELETLACIISSLVHQVIKEVTTIITGRNLQMTLFRLGERSNMQAENPVSPLGRVVSHVRFYSCSKDNF